MTHLCTFKRSHIITTESNKATSNMEVKGQTFLFGQIKINPAVCLVKHCQSDLLVGFNKGAM